MPAWFWVLFWWLAFAVTHLVFSSQTLRPRLVGALGANGFAGAYSIVALGLFYLIVTAYWSNRHTGPLLWSLAGVPGVRELAIVVAGLGVVLVGMSFFQPSPASMIPGLPAASRGLTRITRHPLFVGLALWGLGHVLVNGWLADVVFFGGFPVFALVGGMHQDSRKRVEQGARLRPFFEETSILPFGAILAGRNRLALGEIPVVALAVGLILAATLFGFHDQLFG